MATNFVFFTIGIFVTFVPKVIKFVCLAVFSVRFTVYISAVGFLCVSKVLTLSMVMAKEKFDFDFSLWCYMRLKLGKRTLCPKAKNINTLSKSS
mgnify:FL=1